MNIVDNSETLLHSVRFSDIRCLDKFATVANNRLVVWRKLTDKLNYLHGEDPSCDYTCPQPNAVTDTGFPAVFNPTDKVFKVESCEYNDHVLIGKLKRETTC